MSLIENITNNSPITNIMDLFSLHHGNPLGVAPVWQLVFVALVALVMEYFQFHIRWRQKPKYYPVLYTLLAVVTVGLYYYCFQSGLPQGKDLVHHGEYDALCWFCNHEIVGWSCAVPGIIALVVILYIILCAIQQVCAQLTMEANPELLATKPWKEFILGVFISLLPAVLVFLGLLISDTATSWMFLAGCVALVCFVIVKTVLDSRRTHSALWGIFINLTFLLCIIPVIILSVGLVECWVAYIVVILILFTCSKARKKKGKNE